MDMRSRCTDEVHFFESIRMPILGLCELQVLFGATPAFFKTIIFHKPPDISTYLQGIIMDWTYPNNLSHVSSTFLAWCFWELQQYFWISVRVEQDCLVVCCVPIFADSNGFCRFQGSLDYGVCSTKECFIISNNITNLLLAKIEINWWQPYRRCVSKFGRWFRIGLDEI